MKKKTLFITIGVIMFASLVVPVLYFWVKFRFSNISSNVSDWGDFGSYVGGIVTPIISIYSVIILGYITYLLSRNSNEENKKLYLLQRKLEAYEEFSKYFPRFNKTPLKLQYILQRITRNLDEIGTDKELHKSESEEIFQQVEFFVEFYYFLFNFNLRYGHLFDYDFESNDYKKSLSLLCQVKDDFLSIYEGFVLLDFSLVKINESIDKIAKMMDYLVNFTNDIRKEIER
jgi:hypothetical protein